MSEPERPAKALWEMMAENAAMMLKGTPQAGALNLTMVELKQGRAITRVPYHADLVGDPETGVIAGGVITTLLDNTCGLACQSSLEQATSIATLDLRIDYMRPALPGRDVLAEAIVYRLTRTVAFVRAFAYEDTPDDPVASAQCAFMIGANSGRRVGANLKPPK
jgi:uncharacterized protein (TIGR00369 family)